MSNTPLTPEIKDLLQRLKIASQESQVTDKPTLHISEITSLPAFAYEKIRNFIDYKDEYLLRKNAIKRFLRRYFLLPKFLADSDSCAKALVRELVLTRYLKNDSVAEEKLPILSLVIKKYQILLQHVNGQKINYPRWRDFIFGLAAVECDTLLVSPTARNAYTTFAWQQLKKTLQLSDEITDLETFNIQLVLTIQRILERADQDITGYYLLVHYYPQWFSQPPAEAVNFLLPQLSAVLANLKHISEHSVGKLLTPHVRRTLIPIMILQKTWLDNETALADNISNANWLSNQIHKTYTAVWHSTRQRLRRKGFHAIVYIFLTKMVLALLIEFPYEKLILHSIHYLPLAINLLFPPFLMGIITVLIKAPGSANENRVVEAVLELAYGKDTGFYKTKEIKKPTVSWWGKLFYTLLYLITIFVSFGLVISLLNRLNFNFLSGALFILFISLVSFFGLSLRQQARQLRVIKEKDTLSAFVLDFFSLPVVTLGKWLSTTFDKVNIFVFILDFLIELPFKTLLTVIERWFQFLRDKRDQVY